MKLVIGGAYQGKREYVRKNYTENIIDCEDADLDKLFNAECICNFHKAVGYCIQNGIDSIGFSEEILSGNPDIVIIMDEIGNGIVPVDKSDRQWREAVGRTGCFLAERAVEVIRVVCGCGVKIK